MSDENSNTQFRPSGSMCASCSSVNKDCSGLPFNEMRPMKTDKDGTKVVVCNWYSRLKAVS